MRALKIVYKEGERIFLGKPVEIMVPAKDALKYRMASFHFEEKYTTGEFRIKGKVIKGILIGFDEYEMERFERRYTSGKTGIRGWREKRNFYSYKEVVRERDEIVIYSRKKEEYLFRKAEKLFLFGWNKEDSGIIPVICGVVPFHSTEKNSYIYYSGGNEKIAYMEQVGSIDKIPSAIFRSLKRYKEIPFFDFHRSRRFMENLYEILPFPPYEVIAAVKLLPPERVKRAKEEKLPESLQDIFILKAFLMTFNPLPVMELSAGKLKTLSSYLHGDVLDPDVSTESPDDEYRTLFDSCAEYLLLCKPKWPI